MMKQFLGANDVERKRDISLPTVIQIIILDNMQLTSPDICSYRSLIPFFSLSSRQSQIYIHMQKYYLLICPGTRNQAHDMKQIIIPDLSSTNRNTTNSLT